MDGGKGKTGMRIQGLGLKVSYRSESRNYESGHKVHHAECLVGYDSSVLKQVLLSPKADGFGTEPHSLQCHHQTSFEGSSLFNQVWLYDSARIEPAAATILITMTGCNWEH